jgi:hypothetical protein
MVGNITHHARLGSEFSQIKSLSDTKMKSGMRASDDGVPGLRSRRGGERGGRKGVNMIHESSRDRLNGLFFVVGAMHLTSIQGF